MRKEEQKHAAFFVLKQEHGGKECVIYDQEELQPWGSFILLPGN